LTFLGQDIVVLQQALCGDGGLERLALLDAQPLPRVFVHDDQARGDDMPGKDQILLNFEEFVALDGRQWILLSVDRALAQRQIKLTDVKWRRTRAPSLRHGTESIYLRDSQLEAFQVLDPVDQLGPGSEMPFAVVGRTDNAHRPLGDE